MAAQRKVDWKRPQVDPWDCNLDMTEASYNTDIGCLLLMLEEKNLGCLAWDYMALYELDLVCVHIAKNNNKKNFSDLISNFSLVSGLPLNQLMIFLKTERPRISPWFDLWRADWRKRALKIIRQWALAFPERSRFAFSEVDSRQETQNQVTESEKGTCHFLRENGKRCSRRSFGGYLGIAEEKKIAWWNSCKIKKVNLSGRIG